VANSSSVEQHPYVPGDGVDYTWSAQFTFERPHTFKDVVVHRLGGLVAGFADPEWPVSGAVLGSGTAEDRTTLVLGLDPSQRFGTPDIPRCEEIAAKITETLGWQRQPENLPEMRIIMGRRIGYDGAEYSVEDVRGLAVARSCGELALEEGDLFSLRYIPGEGVREYHEPGVIIGSSASSLEPLKQVAGDMGQDRLVPEITDVATQVYFQPS
jgi:hypothetical protein